MAARRLTDGIWNSVSLAEEPPQVAGGDWAESDAHRQFEEVWERHACAIYRCCLHWMSGRREYAEEAFSRAGLTAFHKFSTLRGGAESERGWLNRVAHNVCIDLHRERRRLREQSLEQAEEEAGEGSGVSDESESPEERLLRDELVAQLHSSIGELPSRLREPLLLHLERDLRYREIAEILQITEVTVRKRMQEARDALRGRLAELAARGARAAGERFGNGDVAGPSSSHGVGSGAARRAAREELPRRLRAVTLVLPGGLERDLWLPLARPERSVSERRLAALCAYVGRHPGGAKKRLELARLLLAAGRAEEALAHYFVVARRRPHLLAAWSEPAELLRALGRNEEAGELCLQGLLAVRGCGSRGFLRGMLAAGEERLAAAVEELSEVAVECPAAGAEVALGRLWLSADHPSEALEAFAGALRRDPDDTLALTFGHEALLLAECPRTALARAERACALDPEGWLALSRRIELRCRAGRASGVEGRETRHLLQQLRRIAPDRVETHLAQALYHLARCEWDAAAAGLLSFLSRHPHHATGWFYRGLVLGELGELTIAAAALKRAMVLEPDRREIQVALCRTLGRSGQAAAAGTLGEEMFRRFPESWSVAAAVAWSAFRRGETALALQHSQRAVTLQPRLPAAWLAHGELLLESGLLPEALSALGALRELLPTDQGSSAPARVALLLARCHALAGDVEAVRPWYLGALEGAERLYADSPAEALAVRGGALAGLGDHRGALAAYRDALAAGLGSPLRREAAEAVARLAAGTAAATGGSGAGGEKSRTGTRRRPISR